MFIRVMAEKQSKCPSEIQPSVDRLRKSLDEVEKILEPFVNGSVLDVQEKFTSFATKVNVKQAGVTSSPHIDEQSFVDSLPKAKGIYAMMTSLEKAKMELVSLYAINSLFWMYLCTQGVDLKEHPIKHELARIQQYMKRMKQITDREKAAKLDKPAVKRFINSALWDGKKKGETSKKRKANSDGGDVPNKR